MRSLKIFLTLVAIAALGIFYSGVAYLVVNPSVSDEYRFHYIVKNTLDWRVPRYFADPQDGIDFSLEGYPSYVLRTEGLDSVDQPWGRWTDAKLSHTPQVVFEQAFAGRVCLELLAQPSSHQIGKRVRFYFGQAIPVEILTSDLKPHWYRFEMDLPTPSQTLVIQPEDLGGWAKLDPFFFFTERKHLGVHHLIVTAGQCKNALALP
jgi:hypothetical protein